MFDYSYIKIKFQNILEDTFSSVLKTAIIRLVDHNPENKYKCNI